MLGLPQKYKACSLHTCARIMAASNVGILPAAAADLVPVHSPTDLPLKTKLEKPVRRQTAGRE